MPGKPITRELLEKDASYVRNGTFYHAVLYAVCPPRPGLRVLEVASGSSKFSLTYALEGCIVTALDLDPEVMRYAHALHELVAPNVPVEYVVGSVFELTKHQAGRRWDFVFAEGLSHQWPRSDARRLESIRAMADAVAPGGAMALIVSNALSPEMREYARTVKHTYLGMPETQEPFTPWELGGALVDAGLKEVVVHPVTGDWTESRTILGAGRKP